MNEVTTRQGTAIGADLLAKLKTGIAESRQSTVIAGGKPIMRMLKDADWVFGQKNSPVQKGSIWAINPLSIAHGWVAWTNHEGNQKNSIVGEVMEPVHAPKPPRPAPVDDWAFTEQRMFDMRCLNGDDEGEEVVYKIASLGGLRAVDAVLGSIEGQLETNPAFPCPVVELLSSHYPHPKHGKVYEPVFEIVDWASMDGRLLSEGAPDINKELPEGYDGEGTPFPTPKAARKAAPAPAPAPAAPAPTAQRRPIRR